MCMRDTHSQIIYRTKLSDSYPIDYESWCCISIGPCSTKACDCRDDYWVSVGSKYGFKHLCIISETTLFNSTYTVLVKEFDKNWFTILTNLHILCLHASAFWYKYFAPRDWNFCWNMAQELTHLKKLIT